MLQWPYNHPHTGSAKWTQQVKETEGSMKFGGEVVMEYEKRRKGGDGIGDWEVRERDWKERRKSCDGDVQYIN